MDDLRNARIQAPRSILPPVRVSYFADQDTWLLLEDYLYEDEAHDVVLRVHQGFTFDLSSVPRVLWWGIAPHELSLVAPLYHDALYRFAGRDGGFLHIEPRRTYTRQEADRLFKRHMTQEGVSGWRKHVAYSAVRLFGGSSWRDDLVGRNPFRTPGGT